MLECSIPVYELLEHEHKLGVCNFSFEAWQDYEKPIINKEQIIVQYGPRRQIIQPLYNQANNNPNNVHKLENFVHHNQGGGGAIIATAITPVLFTNSPTLFSKFIPTLTIVATLMVDQLSLLVRVLIWAVMLNVSWYKELF